MFKSLYPKTRNRIKVKIHNTSIYYTTQSLFDMKLLYENINSEFENNFYLKNRLTTVLYSPMSQPSFNLDESCYQITFTTRLAYNDYHIFEKIFEKMLISNSIGIINNLFFSLLCINF